MSHIATIKTEIKDLEAIKLACTELGLEFLENQTTCAFWPSNGAPQQHPCTHAVRLPVGTYKMELGLVKTKNGFDLVGDNMLHIDDPSTCRFIFGRDKNPLGAKYGKFVQAYSIHKATLEAKKRGYLVTRRVTTINGMPKVQLVVTGM